MSRWRGVIEEYRAYLPVNDKTPVVTLNEGNTPLVRAANLEREINPALEIYLKYEGLNPTGSFKDRGMTMAVSKALEAGSRAVICASTGNTSASAAAFAARAGIACFVLIPEGKIALGKLSQAMVHGATVVQVRGNFDDALRLVREISESHPVTLVNSLNPYRIDGQTTAAFEICDRLDGPPDFHLLPVGNAGNITAYWKGYRAWHDAGRTDRLPVMLGFQAAGAAPIVQGAPVANPETVATAIRIGNPASWKQAEAARDESGGLIEAVTDEEIIEAYLLLASREGVFCEPASAASLAGLRLLQARGFFTSPARLVLTLTGHGLKDPDLAISVSPPAHTVEAGKEAVLKVLGF